MPNFAEQLTAARKAAGMTQEQLADAVHVARNTVSSWERGRTQPDLQKLQLLGQVLQSDFGNVEASPASESDQPADAALQTEKAPENILKSETEKISEAMPGKITIAKKNIIIGAVALVAVVVLVCLLVIPKLVSKPVQYMDENGKVYVISDYKKITPKKAGKAYLSMSTTLEKLPSEDGGQFFYTFHMKEENGISFTIDRMEYVCFFYAADIVSVDTFTADDIRSWEDDHEIQPYGEYALTCGINAKTPSGTPNAIGAGFQVWGTDANGEQLTFTAYITLPQE